MSAAEARLFDVDVRDFESGLSPVSDMPPEEFRVSLRELHSIWGMGVRELRRRGWESEIEERE